MQSRLVLREAATVVRDHARHMTPLDALVALHYTVSILLLAVRGYVNPRLALPLVLAYAAVLAIAVVAAPAFHKVSFIAGLIIFSCFFVQSVLPAQEPIHYDPSLGGYLKAGPISKLAAEFLSRADIPDGAIPSGHVAGTAAVLMLSWRHARTAFWITLPLAVSLCVSTVYCRYHYAVDGIAGLAVAFIGVRYAGRLYAIVSPFHASGASFKREA